MSAEVISLSEYKNKLQEKELSRLKEQVDEIIENLPEDDSIIGWYDYDNPNYTTWLNPDLNLEYVYEQPQSSCPCCGKSYDEE